MNSLAAAGDMCKETWAKHWLRLGHYAGGAERHNPHLYRRTYAHGSALSKAAAHGIMPDYLDKMMAAFDAAKQRIAGETPRFARLHSPNGFVAFAIEYVESEQSLMTKRYLMPNAQNLVTLPHTEVHLLQSSYIEQEYKIFVSLPVDYASSEETFPVVYVVDANWFFSLFYPYKLVPMPPVPSMIVVGVGYTIDGFDDILQLRARDFYPGKHTVGNKETKNGATALIELGDSSDFLSFVREDLFPFIDAQYRTNAEDRTLWGYSSGGTFGTYTLFKQPSTFQRYIINAPSLHWGDPDCFAYESQYAEIHTDLAAKLYFCVGALDEFASPLVEFHEILKNRNYPSLAMELSVYKDETHVTGVMPSITWGLRSVFG